jgi:hypothetical protein
MLMKLCTKVDSNSSAVTEAEQRTKDAAREKKAAMATNAVLGGVVLILQWG